MILINHLPLRFFALADICLELARVYPDTVATADLNESQERDARAFEQVLQFARHHNIIVGQRGRYGGTRLARPPYQITLAEILYVADDAARKLWPTMLPRTGAAAIAIQGIFEAAEKELAAITLSDLLQAAETSNACDRAASRHSADNGQDQHWEQYE